MKKKMNSKKVKLEKFNKFTIENSEKVKAGWFWGLLWLSSAGDKFIEDDRMA